MNNNSENMGLSKSKYISIIVGAIVGIGVLVLPSSLAKDAHQDGWIASAVGIIYPIIFWILSLYIIKNHPNENILVINKRYFGKILGSTFNLVWLSFFGFIAINVLSGYSNLMRSYVVGWLTPFKFLIICAFASVYAGYKGLQTVGRVCEVSMVLTIILLISPIPALKIASSLNIRPILGSGIKGILTSTSNSLLSYSGVEVMLLLYPYVKEKKNIKWYSLISIIIVCILYMWVCFIATFYLGPDIVTKSAWPIILATQSVTVTIINNYSYFFILMWGIIGMRCVSVYYYSSILVIKDFLPKVKTKYICLFLYIVFVYLSLKMGNEIHRRSIVDKVIATHILINFIALLALCILIYFKRNEQK